MANGVEGLWPSIVEWLGHHAPATAASIRPRPPGVPLGIRRYRRPAYQEFASWPAHPSLHRPPRKPSDSGTSSGTLITHSAAGAIRAAITLGDARALLGGMSGRKPVPCRPHVRMNGIDGYPRSGPYCCDWRCMISRIDVARSTP